MNRIYAAAAAAASVRWGLDRRQADVLALVLRGCNDQLIARTLGCTEGVVVRHVTELCRLAEVRTRANLIKKVLGGDPVAAAS